MKISTALGCKLSSSNITKVVVLTELTGRPGASRLKLIPVSSMQLTNLRDFSDAQVLQVHIRTQGHRQDFCKD